MRSDVFTSRENYWLDGSGCHLKDITDSFLIKSSGTTSSPKWIVYNKENFLAAAKSANLFLQMSKSDIWLSVLPKEHVAGFSVLARAHVGGYKAVLKKIKWSPEKFKELLLENRATAASLVPTQVFDLSLIHI